jgi:hypothetical protein
MLSNSGCGVMNSCRHGDKGVEVGNRKRDCAEVWHNIMMALVVVAAIRRTILVFYFFLWEGEEG